MGLFKKKEKKADTEDFTQDLNEKAEYQNLYMIHLLFEEKPVKPDVETIQKAVIEKFGDVDVVSDSPQLTSFAVKKYLSHFKDASLPPQIIMAEVHEFDQESIDGFSRSQLWEVADRNEVLEKCRYELFLFDMMAAGMDYKERGKMLAEWLETALSLFPDCTAVWVKPAGKLFTASQVRNFNLPREDRFVRLGVNVRFFNIQGSDDKMIDTLGLYAFGLPDIQYHFHGLVPDDVVRHAYSVASYLYEANAPVNSGETIDGLKGGELSPDVQWVCQYEESLIQPVRLVMDICPGEYAAGNR